MKRSRVFLFCAGLFMASSLFTNSYARQWTLSISGEVQHPIVLTPKSVGEMPRTTVSVKNSKGVTEKYEGVLLSEILARAGAPMGDSVESKNQTWYVQAEALDGYKVIFALPEIDTSFGANSILLADMKNSAPLEKKSAPLEIIVPREHRHARWIRQVEKLRVLKSQE